MKPGTQTCGRCGGSDIAPDITISQAVETGTVGLQYRTAGVFTATEGLLADLCRVCGTVVRFHVRTADRKWVTNPG